MIRSRLVRASAAWPALLITAIAAALGALQGLGSLDLALADLLRPPAPPIAQRIVIVAIDDASLAQVGRWPWSRLRHAELIEQLLPHRPRAIGLDLLLTEAGVPAEDAVLADVMRRSGRVVLPVSSQPGARDLHPLPAFERAAAAVGRVDIAIDADGLVRGVQLGGTQPPHFALALAQAGGQPARLDTWQAGEVSLLEFRAPEAGFRRLSYVQLLAGQFDPTAITGAYVLVGMTATGLGDAYPTPASPARGLRPGVDVLATALEAVLSQRAARLAPPWLNGLINAAAVLVACLLLARVRTDRAWLAMLVTLAAYAALVIALRATARVQVLPLAGAALVVVAYLAWSAGWLRRTLQFVVTEVGRLRSAGFHPSRTAGAGLAGGLAVLREQSAAMRQAQSALTQSLDGLADAAFVIDANRSVLVANAAARQAFPAITQTGARPDFAAIIGARLRPAGEADQGELLADHTLLRELMDEAGSRFLLRSVPRTGPDGEPLGWVASLLDARARPATPMLSGEALGHLSHDMRAPQASILSLLELRRAGALAGSEDEVLQRIGRLAETTLAYADDFIHLARAESAVYAPEPRQLLDIVAEVADQLWAKAKAAQVAIAVEGEEVWCLGDRALLHRAVQNLLDNAIKFAPAGTSIECRLSRRGDRAVLQVRDHGRGLGPDAAALFQPFAQGTGARGGVGLGLSLVRTVVQRHGGRIEASNAEGGGALFEISLPATDPPADPDAL